jgi:PAS domain S-box-containing protein
MNKIKIKSSETHSNHTLNDLELHNFQIDINLPGGELLEIFHNHPKLPGVIVSNGQEIVALISRRNFLEHMSRMYSLEIYSRRPIEAYLRIYKTDFIRFYIRTSIEQAAQIALERPLLLAYEPVVIIHENGQLSLLDMPTLLLAQSQALLKVNNLMEQQQKQTQDYLNTLELQKNQLHYSKEKLKESEERYRHLVEFSPETIVVHHLGKIKYINLAGAKLFGVKRPVELIGKSIFNFLYSNRQETLEAQAQLRQDTKEAVMLTEDKLVRFDEQVIDVEIVETSIVYRGEPAIQVLIRDITERKQTESTLLRAKVIEAEKLDLEKEIATRKQVEASIRAALEKEKELGLLKSRFVTMTSHEFRTPLTTILSSSELLERYSHKWSEDKKLSHLKRIQVGVKQMTDLLNDVLLIGKAEAGKLEFNPTSLDLVQFCRDLVEEMELTSISHKITFRTQAFCTNSQCVTACMDEKLLRHILSNLLSNAIKYSPQDSTINFSFVCQQGCAVFQIEDQGIGVPIADQDKLFDSFHRASNVGTISGTGLGLAIVKKSVDLHGGKIKVSSEVGIGTTFTVSLPLLQQVISSEALLKGNSGVEPEWL